MLYHAIVGFESPQMHYLAEALLLNVVLENLLKGPKYLLVLLSSINLQVKKTKRDFIN